MLGQGFKYAFAKVYYCKLWETLSKLLIRWLESSRQDWCQAGALLTFTCSKSTIETLEKGGKYVQI